MMLTKAISKSGKKIIKAIKKMSKARMEKKQQQKQLLIQQQQQQMQLYIQQQLQLANLALQMRLCDLDDASVASCSLPSLDQKSIDTFYTYVPTIDGYPLDECCVPHCCCHCDETEDNQLNENLENEMMH